MILFMVYMSIGLAREYYRINSGGEYTGDKLLMQYFKVNEDKKLRKYIKIINNSDNSFVSCLSPKEYKIPLLISSLYRHSSVLMSLFQMAQLNDRQLCALP